MVEEGVEVEEQQDTQEVPSNPRIGVEVEVIMKNTISGTLHKQLALVEG